MPSSTQTRRIDSLCALCDYAQSAANDYAQSAESIRFVRCVTTRRVPPTQTWSGPMYVDNILLGRAQRSPTWTIHLRFSIYYILGECRALWGERSEAWYRVTVAADAEAATYVKRVYVDYL